MAPPLPPAASHTAVLKAITFDYWDTLFVGTTLAERLDYRRAALRRLLQDVGHPLEDAELVALYHAAGVEFERWWREEHRGYTTDERIRWMLARLGITRPADCEHVARAVAAVDEALFRWPPPLLPGAAEAVAALAERYRLAVVSDTGFASGRAQDLLLEDAGLRRHFVATVYSADVGHAKPRAEPFRAALAALDVAPHEALHVGDIERTDVRGALAAGMRAVRIDAVRASGPTHAERVVGSLAELVDYLGS